MPIPSSRRDETCSQDCRPRQRQPTQHRQIKIERTGMVILVRDKPLEVMLNNELIDKGPAILCDHRSIPNTGDGERKRQAPNETLRESPARRLASDDEIDRDDPKDNDTADQALGEQGKSGEDKERDQQRTSRSNPVATVPDSDLIHKK